MKKLQSSLEVWDILSIAVLVLTACIAGYFALIFIDPNSSLNVLPPTGRFANTPTSTPAPIQLEPKWTASPTLELTPTRTPVPTWTPFSTSENVYLNKVLAWGPGVIDNPPHIFESIVYPSYCVPSVDSITITATESNPDNFNSTVTAYLYDSVDNLLEEFEMSEVNTNTYLTSRSSPQEENFSHLLLKDNGNITWGSKNDSNYSNGWVGDKDLPFLTKEIADKVLTHNKDAIQNRRQREIDLVLTAGGFYKRNSGDSSSKNNFGGFVRSKIFTPDH